MSNYENMRLGQYQLIEAIGHGGMATVYKAHQETLDRFVAVKVLLSNRDPQFAARFKREARAIAALQHHNILPIYDYGEQDGLLYFVMQYVDTGVTLHDMLGRPIAPIESLRLTGHVLHALDYAHARNVVHRDIKPANILLPSPTWALLADFGIAKLLNDSQHLTMTGFIIGTAAYMAPEQAAGKPIDARTDLYSLGVVLYEMLTGQVPFDAETPMAMLTKHVYEPPPPPRVLNPDLSPLLETVLLRALEKDPNARYQSAAEMAADLEQVAQHLGRPRPSSQVTSLYQAGVEAFEQGRYEEASERLSRLVALDPNYEDASLMLRAAQAALAHAKVTPKTLSSLPSMDSSRREAKVPVIAPAASQLARRRWLWPATGGAVILVVVLVALALVFGSSSTPPRAGAVEPSANARPGQIVATAVLAPSQPALDTPPSTATSAATIASIAISTSSPTSPPQPTAAPATSLIPPADAVVAAAANLRNGPDTSFLSLGVYAQGAALHVTGKTPAGDWVRVEAPDGTIGWMVARNLLLNIDLAGVAVVEAPPTPTLPPTPTPRPTPKPRPTAPPTETPAPPTETPAPPTETPAPTKKPSHNDGKCTKNCAVPPP